MSHAQKLHRQVVLLRRGRTLHHPVGHLSGQGCPVSVRTGPAHQTPLICWPLNSPELSQAAAGTEMASLQRCASPRTPLRLENTPVPPRLLCPPEAPIGPGSRSPPLFIVWSARAALPFSPRG